MRQKLIRVLFLFLCLSLFLIATEIITDSNNKREEKEKTLSMRDFASAVDMFYYTKRGYALDKYEISEKATEIIPTLESMLDSIFVGEGSLIDLTKYSKTLHKKYLEEGVIDYKDLPKPYDLDSSKLVIRDEEKCYLHMDKLIFPKEGYLDVSTGEETLRLFASDLPITERQFILSDLYEYKEMKKEKDGHSYVVTLQNDKTVMTYTYNTEKEEVRLNFSFVKRGGK